MKSIVLCLLGLFLSFQQCISAHVEGVIDFPEEATHLERIQTRIELIEVNDDPSKTPLKQTARVNEVGGFEFWYIPTGSYVLSVSSLAFNIQPLKTKVIIDEEDQVKAYILQAAKPFDKATIEVPHPIRYIPDPTTPRREYLKKRSQGILESGPIATIVNNPMYLGGAVLMLILVVGPMMLEKFDPETARLVKEQRNLKKSKSSKAALEHFKEDNVKKADKTSTEKPKTTENSKEKIEEMKKTTTSSSEAKTKQKTKNRKKKA